MSIFRRLTMSRQQADQAAFIGEKVDYLFRQVRHPSGREYTVEEVGRALGKPAAYVSRLRRGHVASPGAEVVGALGDFFGVDRMYWFRPVTYLDEHDPNYPYPPRPPREVTPEEVEFVAQMVAQLQDRLAAQPGDPDAKTHE